MQTPRRILLVGVKKEKKSNPMGQSGFQLSVGLSKMDSREEIDSFARANYPAVFRMVRHLTGSYHEAEEVTQIAFIKATERWNTFRGEADRRTWVMQIAYREMIRFRRRLKVLLNLDAAAEKGNRDQYAVDGEWLLELLGTLPKAQKEAFVLHHIEDLSFAEIAIVTGVPEGTAKARAHYARESLKKKIQHLELEVEHVH